MSEYLLKNTFKVNFHQFCRYYDWMAQEEEQLVAAAVAALEECLS